MATGIEDAGFEIRDQLQWLFGGKHPKSHNISIAIDKLAKAEREIVGPNPNRVGRRNWDNNPKNITVPATEEAKYWAGWGTGLKPSNELIVLARKPVSEGSVARNVLKFGTGGINIDACKYSDQKRHPSNTILDEDVAEMLGDKAKFFYCPKVSLRERNAGCEHLEPKQQNGKGRTYNDRCAACKKKFIGPKSTICQCPIGARKSDKSVYKNHNHHPTVKPIALMEYLVKLVTPKNGTCLDIFMGSGSTGISCSTLGFDFLGIEIEPEYFEIAKARIQHWQNVEKVA
jgi:site-specific DNA-methyltransferase (adenine-specific)